SGFARTPKTGAEGKSVKAPVKKSYRGSKTLMPVVELLFAAYFTGALWFAIDARIYTSVPFIVLFQAGFLYVGVSSLLQGFVGRVKVAESAPAVNSAEEQPRQAA
ncbi:MAG: glycosyl transferase family 2, partial [Myxococcaceae bacterium]